MVTWATLNNLVLVRFLDYFCRTSSSQLFGLKKNVINTSGTNSQRSSAGIPSVRKHASKEISSDSVELCETEVCFLHIGNMGTNVRQPSAQRILPEIDFESSWLPAKSESWKNPFRQCCAVFPQMATLPLITRVMNVRNQTNQACVTSSGPS